ncbi:uncharacterized protein LOC111674221 [Orussus abietinus]|uniref:uncharacterized protein LOC111674221 n=1 Tax=Orussus abietinus TaxID=222816 RepID=UPI000C715D98|nr:uncharacterized protein LOC111674221 [Orussus abietinus]
MDHLSPGSGSTTDVFASQTSYRNRTGSRPLPECAERPADELLTHSEYLVQVRSIPYLPYVAHKRLVTIVHTPVRGWYHSGTLEPIRIHSRLRPSVLAAELTRIRDLPRPSSVCYLEKYLNSKDHIYFDDEAREIRAKADSLLRRIHVFVPRPSPSDFLEEIVPERMRSDDYVRRLLGARKNLKKSDVETPYYSSPEQRHLGGGNLACVKYVAGKPQPRRKPYITVADLRPADIKSDVNLLSYYSKNRQAAANACE